MPLPDSLPIPPFTRPARGEVALPGSKSITNRALLLAALCDGPVELTNALFSDDTRIMAEALRKLGFTLKVDENQGTILVEGRGGKIPAEDAELFVGLAGTAARFLTAFCAAAGRGKYRLDGTAQMRKRPMKGLFDALRSLGIGIHFSGEAGRFPVELETRGFVRGGKVKIDPSESSQMLSALLMVAPLAPSDIQVGLAARVREPFVKMTLQMMRQFNAVVSRSEGAGGEISVRAQVPYRLSSQTGVVPAYAIEPDATAASYFFALPLVAGGALDLPNIPADSIQGDIAFLNVLKRAGLSVVQDAKKIRITRTTGIRTAVTEDFSEFSDTFLTLAALAPLLDGPTTITGIAHTRKQETDRVAGMARELTRLGQRVVETEDSLEIYPQPLMTGQTIETYGDHRFAMSFGILGCHDLHGDGRPWLTIRDPACCAKTFPNFFELLETVRQNSLVA